MMLTHLNSSLIRLKPHTFNQGNSAVGAAQMVRTDLESDLGWCYDSVKWPEQQP